VALPPLRQDRLVELEAGAAGRAWEPYVSALAVELERPILAGHTTP